MTSMKSSVATMIIACVIICSLGSVKGQDLADEEGICNTKINAKDSKEEGDFYRLISWLIEQATVNGNRQRLSDNGYYGVAECDGHISKGDFDDCLEYINDQISGLCGLTDGARVRLPFCHLRFEHYRTFRQKL